MTKYKPFNMNRVQYKISLFVLLVLGYNISYAQSGVGIGTSNPNPNAILDIVSPSNDKGVLIPRLTTAQRIAMNTSLSTNENGLMAFDSDLDGFYFWNGTGWNSVTVVQDLQLTGNTLTITNNASATDIDLSSFSGSNTDNQTLSLAGTNLTITGGNTLDLSSIQDGVDDADNDPTNEIELPATADTSDVLVWNGSSWVAGTDQTIDADASTTNELITGGELNGTTLRISDAGGNTDVNLASLQDGFEANTDNQNLGVTTSGTNRTVSITGGTSVTFSVEDNDNNASNELILGAGLIGTTLRISDAGGNTFVNLAPLQDGTGTDSQTLSFNGSTNLLTISGGNSVTLSSFPTSTKDAFKAYLGNSLSVPPNTSTGLNFNTIAYDLNGSYSGGEYKISADGIYSLSGVFDIQMEKENDFIIFIIVNGSPRYSLKDRTLALGGFTGFGFSTELQLNTGDVVEFVLFSSVDQLLNGGEEFRSYIAGRLVLEL